MGVLRTSGEPAQAVLQVSLEQVRHRLLGTRLPSKGSPSGHIPFTANAKKAMELALRTSLELGQGRVTTAHLLAGIMKVDDPLVSGALVRLGVDPAQAYLRARTWASGDDPPAVGEPGEAATPIRRSQSVANLQQQRDGLARALRRYGHHEEACRAPDPGCTCGFDEALDLANNGEQDAPS